MTTTEINTIEDLARILEEQPRWATALRSLLLGEELVALPERVAALAAKLDQLAETVAGLSETVARLSEDLRRLYEIVDQLSEDLRRLYETVAGLAATVQQIQATQEEMLREADERKGDMAEVKGDVAGLKDDMTEVKGDVAGLKDDMTEVKGDLNVVKDDMTEVKGDMAEVKEDMTEVKGDLNVVKNRVGSMRGTFLEIRISNKIIPLVSQALGLRRAEIMQNIVLHPHPELIEPIYDATDDGLISESQEQRLRATDIILKARRSSDRATVWVAVEVSTRLDESDIGRARESADILSVVFQTDAFAVVAGYRLDPPDQERADAEGVVFLEVAEEV